MHEGWKTGVMIERTRRRRRWLPRSRRWLSTLRLVSVCLAMATWSLLNGGATRLGSAPAVAAGPPLAGVGQFQRVTARPWLDHGKPVVLYIGAQFCPFCAAERWPLVLATSRFGRWSGLGALHSAAGSSGFPPLATYDLLHATYQSTLIAVQTREVGDLTGYPLQRLTDEQGHLLDLYNRLGGIPFVLLGGEYAQVSSAYSPALLAGLSFTQIQALIASQPSSALGQHIVREANVITALVCRVLQTQPHAPVAAACSMPAVRALLARPPR